MLPALGMVHVPRPFEAGLDLDNGAGVIHSATQDEEVIRAICRSRSKNSRGEIEVLAGRPKGLLRDGSTAGPRSEARKERFDLI